MIAGLSVVVGGNPTGWATRLVRVRRWVATGARGPIRPVQRTYRNARELLCPSVGLRRRWPPRNAPSIFSSRHRTRAWQHHRSARNPRDPRAHPTRQTGHRRVVRAGHAGEVPRRFEEHTRQGFNIGSTPYGYNAQRVVLSLTRGAGSGGRGFRRARGSWRPVWTVNSSSVRAVRRTRCWASVWSAW
jgi:hypothetical protein